jgi:hypothetical protein
MNILDELKQNYGSDIQQQLMSQLGLTQQQASSILPKVGPLILGALKQQKDLHGDDQVHGHMQQLGTGDFSDIGAMLRSGADANDPGLGGLLGAKGHQASDMMAQHFSIPPGTAAKIIPMLAPLIIGMLMKKGGGAPGGTPGVGGGGLGGLGRILDRDGDGQILDDIGGMIFGGGSGRGGMAGSAKSGCLGAILGRLLKGRR